MTPGKLRWGLLFIIVGIMLLLNNAGRLDWGYWYDILMWWPLLLIAIGIEKIFLRTKLQVVSYLSPLLLVAAMIFVAVETGSSSGEDGFFDSSRWSEDFDSRIDHIDAVINHDNTDLYISRTSVDLVSARFDRFSRKPDIDFSKSDGTANLVINERRGGFGGAIVISGRKYNNDWRVSFTDSKPLSLKCVGDGSDITLNLQSIPLQDITIENEGCDIDLRVGEKSPYVAILIDAVDSDFRLNVPAECGVEVIGNQYASYLSRSGFINIENNYYTEGYDSSAVKVRLDIPAGLNNLSLDFE